MNFNLDFNFPIIVNSEEETSELANKFASFLKGGEFIILNGNLGAGKTFFIKQILNHFGIENASSPSFAIVNEHEGKFKVFHFDFYRIKKVEELYDIGFKDYLNENGAVVFIEWGNMFPEILPKKRLEIEIKILDDFRREFRATNYE